MELTKKRPDRLEGISLLRLIATLGILLYHIGFGHTYFRFLNLQVGVDLFFCISGFLILYTTKSKTAGEFLTNRLIRIVPLYAILTVLTFFAAKYVGSFGQGEIRIAELVKSLFFLPYARDGLKTADVIRPIVGPGWTLYYDVWFAVLFFCAMKCSHRYRGVIAACFCAAVFVLGRLLPQEWALARFLGSAYWFCFLFGIAACYLWELAGEKLSARFRGIWGAAALAALVCFYTVSKQVLLLAALAFAVLFATLLFTRGRKLPRFVSGFGALSYSFYLAHYYVILIAERIFDFSKLSAETAVGTVTVFLLTLGIAFCSHRIIEVWLGNRLKQLLPQNGRRSE